MVYFDLTGNHAVNSVRLVSSPLDLRRIFLWLPVFCFWLDTPNPHDAFGSKRMAGCGQRGRNNDPRDNCWMTNNAARGCRLGMY